VTALSWSYSPTNPVSSGPARAEAVYSCAVAYPYHYAQKCMPKASLEAMIASRLPLLLVQMLNLRRGQKQCSGSYQRCCKDWRSTAGAGWPFQPHGILGDPPTVPALAGHPGRKLIILAIAQVILTVISWAGISSKRVYQ